MTDAERQAWLRSHYSDAGAFVREAIDAAMLGQQLVVPPPEPKLSAVLAAVNSVRLEIQNMSDTLAAQLEAGLGEVRAEVDMMKGSVSGIGTIMNDLHAKLDAALAGMTAGGTTTQATIDEVKAIVADLKTQNAALSTLSTPTAGAAPAAPSVEPTPPVEPAPAAPPAA